MCPAQQKQKSRAEALLFMSLRRRRVCLDGQSRPVLPVAGGVHVKQVHGRESYEPEAGYCGSYAHDNTPCVTIFVMDRMAFTGSEKLSRQADQENNAAKN
jgi:hypothetical protein